MPTPFDELTPEALLLLLQGSYEEWMDTNKLFFDGDHWQEADGWAGPRPDPGEDEYLSVIEEIRRSFASKNIIKEVVSRHVNAVLGTEVNWGITPTTPAPAEGQERPQAERDIIQEANNLLVDWWDRRNVLQEFQAALASAILTGRGSVRLFIPSGQRLEDGSVPAGTPAESISRIFIHNPTPAQSLVHRDPDTMAKVSIYSYSEGDGEGRENVFELSYISDTGETSLVVIRSGQEVTEELGDLPLDGNLWLYEIQVPCLISEQVRQLQRQYNKSLTMMSRNSDLAGFMERTILNGQMPGHYEDDDASGRKVWVSDPMHVGPGTSNWIMGASYKDEQGMTKVLTPDIRFRDPIPVTTFTETQFTLYKGILEEVHQLHALLSGDASPSGQSRRQALADFIVDLLMSKSRVDAMIRGILATVLKLTAIFSGQPDRYSILRIDGDTRINPGPIDPSELEIILKAVDAKLISKETARVRFGIQDPDAEAEKIAKEAEEEATANSNIGAAILGNFNAGA